MAVSDNIKDAQRLKGLVRLSVSAELLHFVLRSIELPAFWERAKGVRSLRFL